MTRRVHKHESDAGAMLIIALLIVTVVALVTGALLTLGNTKFLATVAVRQAAATGYASDAAAKVAISDLELGSSANSNEVKTSGIAPGLLPWVYTNNVDGTGCFGASGTVLLPTATNSVSLPSVFTDNQTGKTYSARVECSPVAGTGIFDSGPANPITGGFSGGGGPGGSGGTGRALTITGTNAPAINLKVLGSGGNNQFAIHGDLAAAGQLAVSNGNLFTDGSVTANGCSPSAANVIAQSVNCSGGSTVSDPLGTSVPLISSVPSAMGTWSGCVFQPGYYDDAKALTTATHACTGGLRFVPGVYYFDFHNNTLDPTVGTWGSNSMSTGSTGSGGSYDTWTIDNNLIAGTATSSTAIPGSCVNPIDNSTSTPYVSPSNPGTGVQFIFGGDSQMALSGTAQIEVCASKSNVSGQAPIAIYGLDGTTAARGALTNTYATPVSQANNSITASSTGSNTFSPSAGTTLTQDIALDGDSRVATYSHTASTTDTATLTLGSLPPATAIPAGSILKNATLTVWHSDYAPSGSGNSVTPALQLKVGSGAATNTANQPATINSTSPAADAIDVTSDLAPLVHAGTLSTANLLFSETAKKTATATVDRVALSLTYFTPVLRGETTTAIPGNCLALMSSATDSASTHCYLINDGGGSSFSGAFVMQGATYMPAASIQLSLGNGTNTVSLRWGLVAEYANLQSQNTFPFAYPVVSIPNSGPGFGPQITVVDLKVYLCEGAVSCSSGGTLGLTSRVQFTDPISASTGFVTPAPKTRTINVLSWAEQR